MAFIKGKQIKDASVLTTKLSGISSTPDAGDILVTGASGVLSAVTVSGDATLASNGALTIASGAIETAMVNANVITGQTAETSADDSHLILIHDGTGLKKMTRGNFTSGLGGGGSSTLTISDGSSNDNVTVGTDTLTFAATANETTVAVTNNQVQIGLPDDVTVGGALTVTGNLTVNGTTTTVNSTTTTVDDPIFTLGGDAAPSSDDNKDRGIEFRWHNGSAAKVGFFGFDDSTGRFSFIPDATNNSEVFSGTLGDIDINALYIGGTSMVTSNGAAKVQSAVAGVGLSHSNGVLNLDFSELTTYSAGGDNLAAGDLICVYDVDDGQSQSVTFQELGQKIAGGSGLAWSTTSTYMYVQTNGSSVQANSSGIRVGTFQKDDLGQTVSSNVTADNTDTGLDITNTPHADQIVRVEVNGVAVELGDGVKTKTCYFSGDSGSNARALADIAAGDSLYWNGASVYSLETDDIVDFIYSSL